MNIHMLCVRLADYKRRQTDWLDEETGHEKKRRMFADILAPDTPATAAAAATAAEKGAEKRARALGGYAEPKGEAVDEPTRPAATNEGAEAGTVGGFEFLGKVLGATGSDRAQRKKRKKEREQNEAVAEGLAVAEGAAEGDKEAKKAKKDKKDRDKGARKFSMN
ncbi:hypothetical protein T492DRAFT_831430 [Pavlovales sp. CCMP2436]|nr:hypothetical protein T492DRAFT_831430 [Pavlovales sp. CCMP2436]